MTPAGLRGARDALRRNDPASLLGEREFIWLGVKDGLYPLDKPKGPEELAKDVAAFGNTPDGGLLLAGSPPGRNTARKSLTLSTRCPEAGRP